MSRVYFHIDLNAFFCNAELLLDPSLKGKPMVVSGKTRRSVVATASYEARKYGINSAMSIMEAQRLCRDLVIVPGHYNYYLELSNHFMKIVSDYTHMIEKASIDECYADMSEVIQTFDKPLDLAWTLQRRILKEVGLPCSIGIGPNMFLAKMASDMKKPLGITVLRKRDLKELMWPLPIKDMRGVGKKTLPLMLDLNINTIGDLANYKNLDDLRPIFGKNTEEIIEKANGIDHREIIMDSESKSMGISETLLEDINDYEELRGLIRSLSRKLSKRLKDNRKAGKHISLRICYYDYRNNDRSMMLDKAIWSSEDIFNNAMKLFDKYWLEGEEVRLIGITVGDFISDNLIKQIDLFSNESNTKDIIDDLNQMMNRKTFVRASTLLDGVKNGDR